MAYKSSPRGDRPVIWVAIHSAEGARTAANLGAYFWRDDIQASSHVGIDAAGALPFVPYSRSAWTIRGGNPISDNAELCGFARWTRDQWLSTGTVDGVVNPRGMLDNTAVWIAARCLANGIPMVKISAADVRAGRRGVISHADYTEGTGDGSHWDPGPNFPWDYVMARANTKGFLMALSDNQQQQMYDVTAATYTGTNKQRNLGSAIADLWNFFFTPGWVPPSYGPGANAVVSTNTQMFYDTPADPDNPDLDPTYGPSINQQLADIRGALAAMVPPDGNG